MAGPFNDLKGRLANTCGCLSALLLDISDLCWVASVCLGDLGTRCGPVES